VRRALLENKYNCPHPKLAAGWKLGGKSLTEQSVCERRKTEKRIKTRA